MSTQYGTIFDTSSIKKQLSEANRDYEGRKTWEGLYSSVDMAAKQQESMLKKDYSKSIADAYATAYKTNSAIMSSNLGQGYKTEAMIDTDIALEQAYDSYRNAYLQGINTVEETAAKANEAIDEAHTLQAENMTKMADKGYEYLQWLYDRNPDIFKDNPLWSRYLSNGLTAEQNKLLAESEQGQDILNMWSDIYKAGTSNPELKSWDEIRNDGGYTEYTDEEGNLVKEWTGLFDDKGQLTMRGADFYDQMFNAQSQLGDENSFGRFLSETDPELYDWAQTYNPYDYTEAGTNFGSFKTMVGLTSTDETYKFAERYGGFTKSELDRVYNKFTSKAEMLADKIEKSAGRDSKYFIEEYQGLTNEIKSLSDDLGITKDLEKDMGITFDELGTKLAENVSKATGNDMIWADTAGQIATYTSIGAGIGGASAGVPGAIVGAIIGFVGSIITSSISAESMKEQNRNLAKETRQYYDQLVTSLVSYSEQKRRQKQIDFNK